MGTEETSTAMKFLIAEEHQMEIEVVPSAMKYLIAEEFFERFSLKGVQTILALFLLERLHYSEGGSTEMVHVFLVGLFIGPLVGALLSDMLWGKYRAILYFSAMQFVGHTLLTLAAIPMDDRDSTPSSLITWGTFGGLFLVVAGSGGIKPCMIAFGGDQIDNFVPDGSKNKSRLSGQFFSNYYSAMNAGSFITTVLTPVLRANGSYALALASPAVSMFFCLYAFWLGRAQYYDRAPDGKIFRDVGGIVSDALVDKLRCKPNLLHSSVESAVETGAVLENSPISTHWLDSAKLKHNHAIVEEVKSMLQVLVLASPTPIFWSLFDQMYSRWVFQARSMNGHVPWLAGLSIEPDQMQALNPLFVLALIPLLYQVVYPFLEKHGVSVHGHPLRRMVTGMALGALAFVMSGFLQLAIDSEGASSGLGKLSSGLRWQKSMASNGSEIETRPSAFAASSMVSFYLKMNSQVTSGQGPSTTPPGNISILWQIPQYLAISIGEILLSISGMEFSYSQSPLSMKSVIQGILNFYVSIGNVYTIMIVAILGEKFSKAIELFVFAGSGFLATLVMLWLTYGFAYRSTTPLMPQECAIPEETGLMLP